MSAALGFALGVFAKATVVLAAASLLALLLRKRSASLRHAMWSLVMVGLLVLPALCLWLPPISVPAGRWGQALSAPVPAHVPEREHAAAGGATGDAPVYTAAAGRFALPTRAQAPNAATPAPWRIDWLRLAAITYWAGVLFLLGRLALAHAAAWRLVRRATEVNESDWLAQLAEAARRLGLRRPVRLLRSPDVPVPFAVGARVLLPPTADTWCPARRRAVLSHELAHVLRRDCLTQSLASVACAMYWPIPLAWWAVSRLRFERELACDDRALALGQAPTDYAGHLLELARAFRPQRSLAGAALAMAAPSQLEQRLLHLLDGTRERGTPGRLARVTVAIGLAIALLPLAAMRATPPALPAVAVAVASAPKAVEATPASGTWTLRRGDRASGDPDTMVHIGLRTPGLNTFDVAMDEIEGFDPDWLRGEHDARFVLHREAGTLRFSGRFRDGEGSGQFHYEANPGFVVELQRRGMRAPTAAEQFSMTRHGASLAYLDALERYGYATPSVESFVHAVVSPADLDYLEEVSQGGLRGSTLDDLVAVANRGLDADDVVRYVEEGKAVDAKQVLQETRKDDDEPILEPAHESDGSTPTTGHWRIYDRHGRDATIELFWDDGTNWRRALDLAELDGDDERDFRIDGEAGVFEFKGKLAKGQGTFRFVPNRDFPAQLRAIGVRDARYTNDHQLKNLAWGGASVEAVEEFRTLGFTNLSMEDLTTFGVFNIRPEFVRKMRAQGRPNTDTVAGITGLRIHE